MVVLVLCVNCALFAEFPWLVGGTELTKMEIKITFFKSPASNVGGMPIWLLKNLRWWKLQKLLWAVIFLYKNCPFITLLPAGWEVLQWECLYVCLLSYLKNQVSKLHKISVHVTCGCGSVLLHRHSYHRALGARAPFRPLSSLDFLEWNKRTRGLDLP